MGKPLDLEHLRLVLPTPFGQSWRQEAVAGAEGIDFEDALFLDAQTGWVGAILASGSGRYNRTEPSQRDERMPRNNLQ